jgi:hypothetical protein
MSLQIALNLARLGYYVHPLAERDKVPIAPHGSDDATRDEAVIRAWWRDRPNANVGISLDKTGLLDIAPDCPEWSARFKANGLPRTTAYTSNSAWHTLYRLPKGGPIARINISKQYDVMSQGNAVAPGSIHPSGATYTLLTDLLPVEDLPLAPAWAVEMLAEKSNSHDAKLIDADWTDVPSGATLAHSRRFQALCKANEQLRAVCGGEHVTIAGDSSTSAQRAVFVNQLIRAKYPHGEIRALALHFQGVLESSPKWFQADIDRLLVKYTPHGYSPESTGVVVQIAPRGGRHYEITAGELLDRYHQHADCGINGIVLEWSVAEAAERLGVSTGTIKRREAELIADGQIRREYGRVILSPDTWEIRSQRIATPQTEHTPAENAIGSQSDVPQQDAENTPENAVCEERARAELTHPPGTPPRLVTSGGRYYVTDGVRFSRWYTNKSQAWDILDLWREEIEAQQPQRPEPEPEATPIGIGDAVRQAFAELPRYRPNPDTGEKQAWQITDKHVFAWLEATYPKWFARWPERAIRGVIRNVRTDLRWSFARGVRTMPADEVYGRKLAIQKSIVKLERRAAAATDPAIRRSWEAQAAQKRGMLALYTNELDRRTDWTPPVLAQPGGKGARVLSRAEGPPAQAALI